MRATIWIVAAGFAVAGAAADEPVVGLPCHDCEAVFDGLPAELSPEARIARADEPGEPMVIEGTVRDGRDLPVSGIIVYAYQTDATGIYPRVAGATGPAARHGRLRGWARTDADGNYRFLTVRPAGYPGTRIPEHVHFHVIEPGRCTYYIDDLRFTDDRRLTDAARRSASNRGGPGIVTPTRDADGFWQVRRDIELGAEIPGYDECGETPRR